MSQSAFSKTVMSWVLNPQAKPIVLSGEYIVSQILPEMRGKVSMRPRAPEARLILRTANLSGQNHEFPNHGHPENEVSSVAYDGQNGLMVMLAGETPRAQLFAGQRIIRAINKAGLSAGVTPAFINAAIVNEKGENRRDVAQIYGPAPFDAQVARLVPVQIPASNGGVDTVQPVISPQNGFALGMRAGELEEAFLCVFDGDPRSVFVKGGAVAAAALSRVGKAVGAKVDGSLATRELMDPFNTATVGIVLAIDKATANVKPIRLKTAAEIFGLRPLNLIYFDEQGTVTRQLLNVVHSPKPSVEPVSP